MSTNYRSYLRLLFAAQALAFSLMLVGNSEAQQTAGFFSVANAVDLPGNTLVRVDGKPLRPDGLKPGKVTGGLGFPLGTHRIEALNGDCKPGAVSLTVADNNSPIVIIYLVPVKIPGFPMARELRFLARPNAPEADTKKSFSIIYVGSSNSRNVVVNGQLKALRPLAELPIGAAGSLIIAENGQPVANLAPDAPGNYLAILYDGQDSLLKATLAQDIVYKQAGRR